MLSLLQRENPGWSAAPEHALDYGFVCGVVLGRAFLDAISQPAGGASRTVQMCDGHGVQFAATMQRFGGRAVVIPHVVVSKGGAS